MESLKKFPNAKDCGRARSSNPFGHCPRGTVGFEFIELLVKELDVIGAPQVDMRFFVLRNARPGGRYRAFAGLLQGTKEVRPGEPLEAKADKRTKSVVVVARPEMYEKIKKVIERIDVPPEFAEADVLIINLRKANAESLSEIIRDMMRPDAKGYLTEEAQAMVNKSRNSTFQMLTGKWSNWT